MKNTDEVICTNSAVRLVAMHMYFTCSPGFKTNIHYIHVVVSLPENSRI